MRIHVSIIRISLIVLLSIGAATNGFRFADAAAARAGFRDHPPDSVSTVPATGIIITKMVHGVQGFHLLDAGPITPHGTPQYIPNVSMADEHSRSSVNAFASGSEGIPAVPTVTVAAPAPLANFEGLHTIVDCTVPPDSDGAVGPTYYVAFVNNYNNCATQSPSGNVGFYCKAASGGLCPSQGTLAAAFYYPDLFTGFSTNCNNPKDHSDPQVLYDSAKDLYLFASITAASPYQMCVAATLSNDPINGAYCVASYATQTSNLPDYDKAGVWVDGFYVSYNPGPSDSRTVVFNKADLEACSSTIRIQDFDMGSDKRESDNFCTPQPNHIFRPVPANYNIFTGNIPATGEPEFIVAAYCLTSHIYVFTLHVDWSNSASSVLTRAFIPVQTTHFAPNTVSSPSNPLDTLNLHLMSPANYFKDGSGNEYLLTTMTVCNGSSCTAASGTSAIGWYQLKVLNNKATSTTVKNQNIWNPDSASRLQAAAAFDRQGDVLMEYTQVAGSQNPAVAYAGRLANGTSNTLGQTETVLFRGSSMGSGACGNQNPCPRWGDYGANFVDPDGCTFWFTHEYYELSDPWQWDTRIGATKYSGCSPLTYSRSVTPTSLDFTSSGVGITTGAQTVTVSNTGTGPIVVQPANITGANAGDFSVSSDDCSTGGAGIAGGASCTVQVTCTPSASGTRTAILNTMTNLAAADSTGVSLSCTTSSPLTAPLISATTSSIDSGQSSTLSTTTTFNGGASPYTCQWLQKGPSASIYNNLGSPFTCAMGDQPTASTGVLSTVGAWSFELQVTDSSGLPVTVTSNVVTVTVNTGMTGTGGRAPLML